MRVLARERRAELARLRSALARTSGTPRDERAPAHGGPLPPIGYQQVRGHIRWLLSVVTATEDQHTTLVRVLGRGDGYAGMSTLRAEAAVMLDDLRARSVCAVFSVGAGLPARTRQGGQQQSVLLPASRGGRSPAVLPVAKWLGEAGWVWRRL